MKVRFSVTFDCEYEIDENDEEWQEEDDDGKYFWSKEHALDRLQGLIEDAPTEWADNYNESITVSELTVKK